MIRLIAVRGPLEMVALPGGAYGVRVGKLAKVFKGSCAQDNWWNAYQHFTKVAKKEEKRLNAN